MIIVEDYEIIHNEHNHSIAFCCNSRVYKIQNFLEDDDSSYVCRLDNDNNLIISNADNEDVISFLKVPDEYNNSLHIKKQVILISGEPSAHDDEPSEIEKIALINFKSHI